MGIKGLCGQIRPIDEDLEKSIRFHNQQHLIEHYELLKDDQHRIKFQLQLKKIDYSFITQLFYSRYRSMIDQNYRNYQIVKNNVATLDQIQKQKDELSQIGFQAIMAGQVAVCLISTDLVINENTKRVLGMYETKLQSQNTLFEYLIKKLETLNKLAFQYSKKKSNQNKPRKLIQVYILTQKFNRVEIQNFFILNQYFGYQKQAIHFLEEKLLPAFDFNGKIMIENKNNIHLCSSGNGAVYQEIQNHSDLKKLGIKYIHFARINNLLLKIADPICLGYLIKNKRDIVSKFTKRISVDEKEKVHVHVLKNQHIEICNYNLCRNKNNQQQTQEIVCSQNFIDNFFLTTQFIETIMTNQTIKMKYMDHYHFQQRKINIYDYKNEKIVIAQENTGIIFYKLASDCFQLTENISLFQVDKDHQYAPINTLDLNNSLLNAKQKLSNLHKEWFKKQGIEIEEIINQQNQINKQNSFFEIDPSLSYNGQNLSHLVEKYKGEIIKLPFYIDNQQKNNKNNLEKSLYPNIE